MTIEKLSETDNSGISKKISINNLLDDELLNYLSKGELIYIIKKLKEGNYIVAELNFAGSGLYFAYVTELTFQGHQFLDTIRNNQVFDKVMEKINDIGSGVTLDLIKTIATKILKEKLGI